MMAVDGLHCQTCGWQTSFADGYIGDRRRTCEGGTEHDWVRPIHMGIDIV